MSQELLIDAAHPEETRVVVLQNNQISEFDFEAETKRPLKGNIYLAKVTRVEPSLQAAFIDYGGNRHGFLAFSDIHPDYYQIPTADREALLRAYQEESKAEEDNDTGNEDEDSEAEDGDGQVIENLGDELDEISQTANMRMLTRKYKIQEVIKRRQIILVQVVREERGNKGAALTTYLSLAGRYCVLMPNTAHGGGISRKISNVTARRKLKKIIEKLDMPQGMGLIIRTAGSQRTAAEIKRDYQYLTRLWENTRNLTMNSIAPCIVYEEGNLIHRSIRDLYTKDFSQIIIDGEAAYKEARSYMKLLMPSHVRKVVQHKDATPLFKQSGVDAHLGAMFSPVAQLPSGGYLVINQTEALVAIDVNSGKATGEYSIEKTALNTNMEAAVEIARQIRLRDLAGLIVIDFIDMDEFRNNRAVERHLKDALKQDRARIQVGRISGFGLLEMSRQRMRSGFLASSSETCAHCQGTGIIRSVESRALQVLRHIEEELAKNTPDDNQIITIQCAIDVTAYILNQKRSDLSRMEETHKVSIHIVADAALMATDMRINGDLLSSAMPSEATQAKQGNTDKKPPRKKRRNMRDKKAKKETTESAATHSEANESKNTRKPSRKRNRAKNAEATKKAEDKTEVNEQQTQESSDTPSISPPLSEAIETKAEMPEDKAIAAADVQNDNLPDITDMVNIAPIDPKPETHDAKSEKPKRSGWWNS